MKKVRLHVPGVKLVKGHWSIFNQVNFSTDRHIIRLLLSLGEIYPTTLIAPRRLEIRKSFDGRGNIYPTIVF